MKAIISHDIDHLRVWEHANDLILPKFFVRAKIELFSGKISFQEYLYRMGGFFTNKWQNIDELIEFNSLTNVPNSFFIGVNNGVGLSYPLEAAAYWIQRMEDKQIEVGVHGIDFDSFDKIKKEYTTFQNNSRNSSFGIRMHYLRKNENTFK